MIPGLLLSILTGLGAERIARVVGVRSAVVLGLLLVAAGFFVVAFTDQMQSSAPILVAFTVMSAGTGLATTLSTDLVVSSVPESKAGAASAVSETGYEVGAVLGTAVLGGLTTAFYQAHLDLPAAVGADSAQAAHETLGGALDVAAESPLGSAVADAAVAAFSAGMQWTSVFGGILVAGVALALFRVLRADRRVRRAV